MDAPPSTKACSPASRCQPKKGPGDQVIGGTLNKTGSFVLRATKVGHDTTLAQIVRLVEEAQGSKAPMQRLADHVSEVFVPAILILAALTFVGWLLLAPEPRLTFALQAAIAVLIIACPCARSRHPLADHGWHRQSRGVRDFDPCPLAEAIVTRAQELGVALPAAQHFQAFAGKGIQAQVDGREVLLGTGAFLEDWGITLNGLAESADVLAHSGATPMFVALGNAAVGLIAVAGGVRSVEHSAAIR
jgi:cation transport ATPase